MKRIIAIIGGVLAVVCLATALLTIMWMWSIQKPVAEKTAKAFQKADDVLLIAQKTSESLRGNLEQSRAHVQIVRVSSAAGNMQDGFFHRMLARTAAKQVAPDVNNVQHALEKVTEASIVVNSILESLRDVDGVENLDNEQVRDLQTKIDGVTRASLDLGDLLDDPRNPLQGDAAERSERIAASLESVIQLVDSFQKGVASLRKKVQFYQSKSQWWIEHGPVYASIGLGWAMISQVVVLAVVVRGFRRKTTQ